MFDSRRLVTGKLQLSFFAAVLVGSSIVHTAQNLHSPLPELLQLLLVTVLSLSFVTAGHLMSRRVEPAQFHWVVYSTIGIGLLPGALSWIASAVQFLQGYSLNEPLYYGVTMMAGGAAAGPYIGYFYARLQQSNAELSHRYEEMTVLNRRLGVANRVLRHNLRNNLTVISGVTGDLQRRVESEPMADRVELLDRRTDELATLSDKMGKIRQVWETNQRTTVDLVPLLERLLCDTASAHPDVTVRTNLPDTAVVTAHPKIEAALREVFENAVRHNATSELSIEVTITETDDGSFTVDIEDSGAGLPDIEQELSAETDPTTSALEHGVGLRLWLVYWTAEKSGGSLSVSNDDGAVVSLTLPQSESDGESVLVRPTQTLQRGPETTARPTHS